MSIQRKIKRHFLIIERINRGGYPSFADLLKYLENRDIPVSHRTLQRDFEHIRNDFAIEIVYHPKEDGYDIDRSVSWNIDTFTNVLQTAISAETLLDNFQDSKQLIEYIDYGRNTTLKGMHLFDQLMDAVKSQKQLSLVHQNYTTQKLTSYTLNPYLLKEYQQRWYVIGTINDTDAIRTFGIDRITELEINKNRFKRNEKLNPKPYFEDIIGLNYTEKEKEEVTIKCSLIQGKYLQAYPLHRSQTIINETSESFTIKFNIGPNYEFRERLLMYGTNIEVISPLWLREEIINSLTETLNRYKKSNASF